MPPPALSLGPKHSSSKHPKQLPEGTEATRAKLDDFVHKWEVRSVISNGHSAAPDVVAAASRAFATLMDHMQHHKAVLNLLPEVKHTATQVPWGTLIPPLLTNADSSLQPVVGAVQQLATVLPACLPQLQAGCAGALVQLLGPEWCVPPHQTNRQRFPRSATSDASSGSPATLTAAAAAGALLSAVPHWRLAGFWAVWREQGGALRLLGLLHRCSGSVMGTAPGAAARTGAAAEVNAKAAVPALQLLARLMYTSSRQVICGLGRPALKQLCAVLAAWMHATTDGEHAPTAAAATAVAAAAEAAFSAVQLLGGVVWEMSDVGVHAQLLHALGGLLGSAKPDAVGAAAQLAAHPDVWWAPHVPRCMCGPDGGGSPTREGSMQAPMPARMQEAKAFVAQQLVLSMESACAAAVATPTGVHGAKPGVPHGPHALLCLACAILQPTAQCSSGAGHGARPQGGVHGADCEAIHATEAARQQLLTQRGVHATLQCAACASMGDNSHGEQVSWVSWHVVRLVIAQAGAGTVQAVLAGMFAQSQPPPHTSTHGRLATAVVAAVSLAVGPGTAESSFPSPSCQQPELATRVTPNPPLALLRRALHGLSAQDMSRQTAQALITATACLVEVLTQLWTPPPLTGSLPTHTDGSQPTTTPAAATHSVQAHGAQGLCTGPDTAERPALPAHPIPCLSTEGGAEVVEGAQIVMGVHACLSWLLAHSGAVLHCMQGAGKVQGSSTNSGPAPPPTAGMQRWGAPPVATPDKPSHHMVRLHGALERLVQQWQCTCTITGTAWAPGDTWPQNSPNNSSQLTHSTGTPPPSHLHRHSSNQHPLLHPSCASPQMCVAAVWQQACPMHSSLGSDQPRVLCWRCGGCSPSGPTQQPDLRNGNKVCGSTCSSAGDAAHVLGLAGASRALLQAVEQHVGLEMVALAGSVLGRLYGQLGVAHPHLRSHLVSHLPRPAENSASWPMEGPTEPAWSSQTEVNVQPGVLFVREPGQGSDGQQSCGGDGGVVVSAHTTAAAGCAPLGDKVRAALHAQLQDGGPGAQSPGPGTAPVRITLNPRVPALAFVECVRYLHCGVAWVGAAADGGAPAPCASSAPDGHCDRAVTQPAAAPLEGEVGSDLGRASWQQVRQVAKSLGLHSLAALAQAAPPKPGASPPPVFPSTATQLPGVLLGRSTHDRGGDAQGAGAQVGNGDAGVATEACMTGPDTPPTAPAPDNSTGSALYTVDPGLPSLACPHTHTPHPAVEGVLSAAAAWYAELEGGGAEGCSTLPAHISVQSDTITATLCDAVLAVPCPRPAAAPGGTVGTEGLGASTDSSSCAAPLTNPRALFIPCHLAVMSAGGGEVVRATCEWRARSVGASQGGDMGGGGDQGDADTEPTPAATRAPSLAVITLPEVCDAEVGWAVVGYAYTGRLNIPTLTLSSCDEAACSSGNLWEGSKGPRRGHSTAAGTTVVSGVWGVGCVGWECQFCYPARVALRTARCADALLLPGLQQLCRHALESACQHVPLPCLLVLTRDCALLGHQWGLDACVASVAQQASKQGGMQALVPLSEWGELPAQLRSALASAVASMQPAVDPVSGKATSSWGSVSHRTAMNEVNQLLGKLFDFL